MQTFPRTFTSASTAVLLSLNVTFAQSVWTDWTSATAPGPGQESAAGALGGVNVSFTGDLEPAAIIDASYSFWVSGAATYTSPLVTAPPPTGDVLRVWGGPSTGEQVIRFSTPVRDPILAILSLGAGSAPARYVFDRPFVIESVGPGYFGNGPLVALAGNVLEGREGNGLVRFPGEHSELRFTIPVAEYWSGFTVGLAGTVGARRCGSASPNSTGLVGAMAAGGSVVVADNELRLSAIRLPLYTYGYFLCSRTPALVPGAGGSQGTLCLGGEVGRFNAQIVNSGPFGTFGITLDLASLPSPTGAVAAAAGESWHFQCWYRDAVAGAATSNFTDSVAIDFL
ncbi:MAG: hypothetical protein R3F49_04785 [Planctomycetota bacterium]